jgi:hypothetical protein
MYTRKNTKKNKIQRVKFEELSCISRWSGELLRIEHHWILVPESQHCNTKNNCLRLKAQAWALFMFKFHQLNPCPTHAQTLSIKPVHANGHWQLGQEICIVHTMIPPLAISYYIDGTSMQQIIFKLLHNTNLHSCKLQCAPLRIAYLKIKMKISWILV